MTETLNVPKPMGLLREAMSGFELGRLLFHLPGLAEAPRGNGEPVLVLPGLATTDATTSVIRHYLRYLGYRPYRSRQGINLGYVARQVPDLVARAARIAARHGAALRIVGWSMGGVIAREVARERPDLVESIITMGTPVLGGPRYSHPGEWVRSRGADPAALPGEDAAEWRLPPIHTPITAIYTRGDGIVSWPACIDDRSPNVEHVEVDTTHCGLGFSGEVLSIVADRLAR